MNRNSELDMSILSESIKHSIQSLNEGITVYRALSKEFDPKFSNKITWVSTEEEYSRNYGEYMYQYDLRIGSINALDLGFRDVQSFVKADDVVERLNNRLMGLYRAGRISKEKAIKLVEILRSIDYSGHKMVWEWMADNKLLTIVSYMGYNALTFVEGRTVTYGILDMSLLKKLN
jgi:hypothetical protein